MTKRPETPSPKASSPVADTGADTGRTQKPRAAEPGTILPARDVAAGNPAAAKAAKAAPPVDSTLVGQGGGLPAISARHEKPLRLGRQVDTAVKGAGANKAAAMKGDDKAPALPRLDAAKTAEARTVADVKAGAWEPAEKSLTSAVTTDKAQVDNTLVVPHQAPAGATAAASPVAPPSAARSAAPAPRRGGFMPLFLGGVTAAALGAGAAWWAIPHLPPAWRPASAPQAPAPDSAALTEAAVAAARAEIDSRAAAIETRAVEAAAQAAQGNGAQPDMGLAQTIEAQAQQLAALDQRLTEMAKTAPATAAAPADLTPLQQQIDALAQRPAIEPATIERLSALAAQAETVTARITAAADAAEARLRETETRASELSAAATDAARAARTTAAAAALGEAIQSGAPRAAALAELQGAGINPPAALTADIPTLDALTAEFPDAARAALRADLRTGAAEGKGSLIGNFLRAQTGARSVTPREGADTDAVLSRAGDALARGAVAQALSELEALPEPARPAMQGWITRARTYADAQTALDNLTAPPPAAAEAATTATAPQPEPQPAPPAAATAASPAASDAAQPGADAAPAAAPSN